MPCTDIFCYDSQLRSQRTTPSRDSRPQTRTNPPSGIAQLRNASSPHNSREDSMNLDDFIFSGSTESPAATTSSPQSNDASYASMATASAIPIKKRQQLQGGDLSLARASAPSVPPVAHGTDNEFGYVQRHVRKTSIDERRVCSVRVDIPSVCLF